MKRFTEHFMSFLFIVLVVFAIIGIVVYAINNDGSNDKRTLARTLQYVQDKNGIVYAIGYGGPSMNTFAMTVVPSSELSKIPEDQIKDLSSFLEKD